MITHDEKRLRHAAAIAEAAVADGSHPTAVIAVANSRETLWTTVVPGNDGAALDSTFLLASITKPIVSTAVMRLVEQGLLLLNLPVASYLPEFGGHGKEQVTTWHLLTHTSGLEEARWQQELEQRRSTPRDFLDAACRSYLNFEPGTRTEYCTLSFWVLGELIALLSGQPYPDYLKEHIFDPLGMKDTAFDPPDPARAVQPHDLGGPERIAGFKALQIPGGGLWSTAADLITFGQTFLRGGRYGEYRLIGPAALDAMTRHHTPGLVQLIDGQPRSANFGLGWGKSGTDGSLLASQESYGHGGASGPLLWIDPAWDLVFVFLSNRWGVEDNTRRRILNAVYGALEQG